MRELKSPGDQVTAGCYCHGVSEARYAMIGDTYMNNSTVGDMANTLFEQAKRYGYIDWLPQTAITLGLAEYEWVGEMGHSSAAMILAKAHVTWHRICAMKS